MALRIEENELLAALLTAQDMAGWRHQGQEKSAVKWRDQYQKRLREFIELNKAEMSGDEASSK